MTQLKLKFDPNQDYQLAAMASITGLFEGLPAAYSAETVLGAAIVTNLPPYQSLAEGWLFDNLRAIQESFNDEAVRRGDQAGQIDLARFDLEVDDGMLLEGVSADSWRCPHFSVEMETGTGKTYVYLRTIYELRKQFGFRKFIIVVPSRAIYEGVIKSVEMTRSHFRALYHNENVNLFRYDSSQMSRVRSFATSTATDILLMTRDAFNRKSNNLYKATEKLPGERLPFEYLQETRPIMILDEPQNMESERSQEAIRTLKPLVVLRYSATHRSIPNLTHRLTPFEACRRGLVKRIAVYGVTERDDLNQPRLNLRAIKKEGGRWLAVVETYRSDKGQIKPAEVSLKHNDDLAKKTKLAEHQGYQVTEINAAAGFVEFKNGERLQEGQATELSKADIFREQIRQTIQRHLEQQRRLEPRGIKVLSLFFIDRVANYTDPNEALIRTLFDEEFERLKGASPRFKERTATAVREGYFARKKSKAGEEYVDTPIEDEAKRKADIAAEKEAYELIMKRKERLLSFEEPVSFIFAHSALKEGWDNPNVFQICTLNQTVSPLRKRQEIGRGLRLCVDQTGERIFDEEVNILTVVANESYRSYVENLQREYEEDGLAAPPTPSDARRDAVIRNELIFSRGEFGAFWQKIMQRTAYRIHIDTPALVEACIRRINAASIPEPVLVVDQGEFVQSEITLRLKEVQGQRAKLHLSLVSTDGERQERPLTLERNSDLAQIFDKRLRGYKIKAIEAGAVTFSNNEVLTTAAPIRFQSEGAQPVRSQVRRAETRPHPVFNLLDRTVRESGITRPTVNRIFKGLSPKKQAAILHNPEGFANVFITEVRNGLADHVAERIEFVVTAEATPYDLEELFPMQKKFPQKELVEAGQNSVYDQVQVDSGEEENFVAWRLKDKDEVLFYFKFPPLFKIKLPTVIGNYNPDWGIVRRAADGQPLLELVRETKGTTRLDDLQFPQEKRKIVCAQKHFRTVGVDYRPITASLNYWWKPAEDEAAQEELGL